MFKAEILTDADRYVVEINRLRASSYEEAYNYVNTILDNEDYFIDRNGLTHITPDAVVKSIRIWEEQDPEGEEPGGAPEITETTPGVILTLNGTTEILGREVKVRILQYRCTSSLVNTHELIFYPMSADGANPYEKMGGRMFMKAVKDLLNDKLPKGTRYTLALPPDEKDEEERVNYFHDYCVQVEKEAQERAKARKSGAKAVFFDDNKEGPGNG